MGFCVSACMTVCVCVHEESKIERKRDRFKTNKYPFVSLLASSILFCTHH